MPLKTFFEKHKVKVMNNNQPKTYLIKLFLKKEFAKFCGTQGTFFKKVNKNFFFFVVDGLAK
jgi:hypothetical protein